PSNPSPASTETASRASTSGSCARICSRRLRTRIVSTESGARKPIAAAIGTSRKAADDREPALHREELRRRQPRREAGGEQARLNRVELRLRAQAQRHRREPV